MAHFAELNNNNVVLRVIVVDDYDTSDAGGTEKEHIGAAFCERHFGGRWIKTSYNNRIRGRFAGPGCVYVESLDVFLDPKPYPSWIVSPAKMNWIAPVEHPNPSDEASYAWKELTQEWVARPTPSEGYRVSWDKANERWDELPIDPEV